MKLPPSCSWTCKNTENSQKSQQNILDGCSASCSVPSNTDWCSDGGGGRGGCPEAEQLHDEVDVYIFCPAVSTSYLVAFQAAPQARRHARLHVSAAQTEFRQAGRAWGLLRSGTGAAGAAGSPTTSCHVEWFRQPELKPPADR